MDMTVQNGLRDFLMSRREKLQPEDVGLPRGVRRRVPGLRREEVASLAGVSADYYVQIERGRAQGVSDEVLIAIARVLRLDETERRHLFDLAGERPSRRPAGPAPLHIAPGLRQLLDAIDGAPAVVQTGTLDVVATNALGRVLYRPVLGSAHGPNFARYVFLDEDSRRFFDDWDAAADDVAAMLRLEQARNPGALVDALVEELSEGSEPFEAHWAAHEVSEHHRGTKIVHDAQVGELRLRYETLEVAGGPGLRLLGYAPDPAHPASSDRLRQLAGLIGAHGEDGWS